MISQQHQRVGVFIDVQNMYYSAKALYNQKVDFGKILELGVEDRTLIRAIAYVIQAEVDQENQFFDALRERGLELRIKELQTFYGGNKKGDWDIGIAMDVMRMASKLDVVVIVSGDGDFTDLLKHAKSLGCYTEAIAFGPSSSSMLREEADKFTDLSDHLDTVLIPDKRKPHSSHTERAPRKSHKPKESHKAIESSTTKSSTTKPREPKKGISKKTDHSRSQSMTQPAIVAPLRATSVRPTTVVRSDAHKAELEKTQKEEIVELNKKHAKAVKKPAASATTRKPTRPKPPKIRAPKVKPKLKPASRAASASPRARKKAADAPAPTTRKRPIPPKPVVKKPKV